MFPLRLHIKGFHLAVALIVVVVLVAARMASAAEISSHLEKNVGRKQQIALLLDYDGTLSPIVRHPDLAVIPPDTKRVLQKLSKCKNIFVAIISGRQADNVKQLVGIDNIVYAGSHGFEIIYPNGSRYNHEVPKTEKELMVNVSNALKNEVVRDGAWIENKGDLLTFHYRETPEEKRSDLIKRAKEIIVQYGLHPSDSNCGIEIQPKIKWHKGYAADFLLQSQYNSKWEGNVKVIFAGDDTTDENLIEMFKGKATTFRIVSSPDVNTSASMRLNSTEDVKIVLKWLEDNYCKT